jgi:hypothetical protein
MWLVAARRTSSTLPARWASVNEMRRAREQPLSLLTQRSYERPVRQGRPGQRRGLTDAQLYRSRSGPRKNAWLLDKPGLPDARRTADQEHLRLASRSAPVQGRDGLQLSDPPDERRRLCHE